MQSFLLIGLPYVAVVVAVIGTVYRLRRRPVTYTARSSQFLESRQLRWGSVSWHIGIMIVLLGHGVVFLFPGAWHALVAHHAALVAAESAGLAAALLSLAGLTVLAVRRMTAARVQAVTTPMDLAVLGLLALEIVLGLVVAGRYRWGAAWSTGTIAPYLWSLATLRPDPSFVADLPPLVQGHMAGAWLLVLVFPFSRLVHLLALPLPYLFRPPIKVVWTSARSPLRWRPAREQVVARREVLLGLTGIVGAGVLLSVGALDKLVRYYQGPRLTPEDEASLVAEKLGRLQRTAEQRALELERLRNDRIYLARLSELSPTKGRYFIDYEMRPALAFRGDDGLPLLLSAKCTHLGCTVGSEADRDHRLLCPCHLSYFDIRTGQPNPGSPATAPLPMLDWVLVDDQGQEVARRAAGARPAASLDPARAGAFRVFMLKPAADGTA